MKNEILVSICTLTYNHAPYLKAYFEGILSQRCNFKYEVIINDDCSTDGTQEILLDFAKKYPDVIKVVIQKENQFSKGDRGFFIKYCFPRCSGKYIAFCEGDDCWIDPLKLQKQVDYLENHSDCVLVHTDMDVENLETGHVFHGKWKQQKNFNLIDRDFGSRLIPLILQGKYSVTTLTACVRHSILKECLTEGLLAQDVNLLMGDTIIWMALATKGSFHLIPDCCACYHIISESATHSKNYSNIIKFYASCLYMIDFFSQKLHISDKDKDIAIQKYINFLLRDVYTDKREYFQELNYKILMGRKLNISNTLLLRTMNSGRFAKKLIFDAVRIQQYLAHFMEFYLAKYFGIG